MKENCCGLEIKIIRMIFRPVKATLSGMIDNNETWWDRTTLPENEYPYYIGCDKA